MERRAGKAGVGPEPAAAPDASQAIFMEKPAASDQAEGEKARPNRPSSV